MVRDEKPAIVFVRMSPQLKEGLKHAAQAAGVSLNAYVVQVLAAAAGHHARFRGTAETGPTADEEVHELRELRRDERGRPLDWKQRDRHQAARARYAERIQDDVADWHWFVNDIEHQCPWHFVEWAEFNAPLMPEGLQSVDRRAAG